MRRTEILFAIGMLYRNNINIGIISIAFLLSSCEDTQLDRNVKNIQKVKTGMAIPEVEKLMGVPDSIIKWDLEEDAFRFMYNVPVGMSDNVYVIFSNADSTVVRINDGQ